jgi:hypothetical protein
MRKGRARLLGVLALVAGIAGAVVLWLLADKRYDDAVADLAPAPVGCEVTLEFDRTGTYTFFVETVGSVGEIDGDCEADDRQYDIGDEVPDVELLLLDDSGDEVDFDPASGPSYDNGDAKGTGVLTAEIEDTGDYVLTASSDDPEAMVRVGRDPSNGVAAMRVGAVAALVAGVVLFILAMARAGRRPAPAPGEPGYEGWPPTGPITRPLAPPYANPPGSPPYAMPPSQVPAQPSGPPSGPWPGSGQPLPPPPPPPP